MRLFKVNWQGQELRRDSIVRVLQQVLEPVGEVQGKLAVYSEMYDSTDNRGVRANEGEEANTSTSDMDVQLGRAIVILSKWVSRGKI